jgi:hypothetical protein
MRKPITWLGALRGAGAAIAFGLALPGSVWAEGCPPAGGIAFSHLEALNQKLLDGDFAGFTSGVAEESNGLLDFDMSSVANIFPAGFDSCATVAQRIEPAGMVQHFVVFRSSIGPLYVYLRVMPTPTGILLQSIRMNTDLDDAIADLQ